MILRRLLILILLGLAGNPAWANDVIPACLYQQRKAMSDPASWGWTSGGIPVLILDPLKAGGGASIHTAEVWQDGDRMQPMLVRISHDPKAEERGLSLHSEVSERYASEHRPEAEQYVVPLGERVTFKKDGKVIEGRLIPQAGETAHDRSHAFQIFTGRFFWFRNFAMDAKGLGHQIRLNARLTADLFHSLGDLNKYRIVHGDIKPENIIFWGGVLNNLEEFALGKCHATLIDLGVAERVGVRRLGTAGTPGYLDPGIITLADPTSRMNDVFGVASMVLENLLGVDTYHLGRRNTGLASKARGADGKKWIHYFNREAVAKELERSRRAMVKAGVAESDLALFDDLARFGLNGIIPDVKAREAALAADPNSILRMDAYGANPAFESRIPHYRAVP